MTGSFRFLLLPSGLCSGFCDGLAREINLSTCQLAVSLRAHVCDCMCGMAAISTATARRLHWSGSSTPLGHRARLVQPHSAVFCTQVEEDGTARAVLVEHVRLAGPRLSIQLLHCGHAVHVAQDDGPGTLGKGVPGSQVQTSDHGVVGADEPLQGSLGRAARPRWIDRGLRLAHSFVFT